jgi:ferredoxin
LQNGKATKVLFRLKTSKVFRKGKTGWIKVKQYRYILKNRVKQWNGIMSIANLLEFGESNGIRMEAGCMFGECGACSTNIIEGKVDYNYKTATRPAIGKCLPCSCFPESDIILDA